jgi:hypothetical protein
MPGVTITSYGLIAQVALGLLSHTLFSAELAASLPLTKLPEFF